MPLLPSTPEPAPGLIRIGSVDIARVAALLARAFDDDPFMRYAIPDPRQRRQILPWIIGLNLRDACRAGAVYATAGFEGAALWLPPGRWRRTPWRILRAGMLAAPLRIPWPVLRRLAGVEAHAQALHERCAPASAPHWYLAQTGVEPALRRHGVASLLLQPMLEHLDAHALPCYLETENAANVAFYERFGFRLVAEDAGLPAGLRIWAMLRPPLVP
jgi:ribosomal protein S18 acetylase RimI-like enzyme